ncbi:hypothetical protein [Alteribacillus persepolensis]|uniref:hypothetical protein n=1 Tax=Alteribacillus persepolensis TaxID=568899 RepID=UPI000B8375C9|nr:hypothetical protein [Alteribacillus persepolensis]
MKILMVTIVLMVLLSGLSLSLDVIIGLDKLEAVKNALNPFRVMETVEMFILAFLVLLIFVDALVFWYNKHKKGTSK